MLQMVILSYFNVGACGPRCDEGVVLRVCNSSGSVIECYRGGGAGKKKYKLKRSVNKTLWFTQCRGLSSPMRSTTLRNLRGTLTECVITMIRVLSWCRPLKHVLQSLGGCTTCGEFMNKTFIIFSFHCPVASCWQVCNLGWCNEATTGKHYTSRLVFTSCSVNRWKCTSKTVLLEQRNQWLNLTKITRNSCPVKTEYLLYIPCY